MTTFQQQNPKLFTTATICGFYWPGVEKKLSAGWDRVFYIYCFLVSVFPAVNYVLLTYTVIVNPLPLPVLIIAFRRSLGMFQMLCNSFRHLVPAYRRQFQQLFDEWNNNINIGKERKQRQALLNQKLKSSQRLFAFVVFFGVFLLSIPGFALLFDRNMRGAGLTYVPHDPQAWYHFILVTLQLITYVVSNMSGLIFNYLIITLLVMADTQLELLREKLAEIFNDETFLPSDYQQILETNRKLSKWVTDHQKTLRWLDCLKTYMNFPATVKYIFIGSYSCLSIFTMPRYVKNGSTVDIVIITVYIISCFALFYYQCKLADNVYEKSKALFDDVYGSSWFLYPPTVTKKLSFIQSRIIRKPVQIKAFSITPDSSATFLSIMHTAYSALSFLLQTDVFD